MFTFYTKYADAAAEAKNLKQLYETLRQENESLRKIANKYSMMNQYSHWDLHSPEGLLNFRAHLEKKQGELKDTQAALLQVKEICTKETELAKLEMKKEIEKIQLALEYEKKLNKTLNSLLEKYLKCPTENK